MKGFLKQILIFLVPVVFLLVVMEIMLQSIPNNYKVKSNYLEVNRKGIETLILGNSHTYYGLNPEWMHGQSFNMSNVSQSLDIDLAILDYYLPKMDNLNTVVMRLSYDSMFETLSKTDEHWRYKDYRLYTNIPLTYQWKHHSELLSVSFKENLKRLYKYYFKNESAVSCNAYGWGTDANSKSAKDLIKTGISVAKKHTATSNDGVEFNLQTLKQIAALCATKNIALYVITPPAFETYYKNLNSNQLETTINAGIQLDSQFQNVHYYNLLENWRFDTDHFFDADHLNERGAELFSKMISDIIPK